MTTLDDELRALLEEFLASGAERADELASAVDRLASVPSDHAALTDLRRHFHRLAGAGATYDCGSISDLGRRGEATVAPILSASRAATETERAGIRLLIETVRAEFDTQRRRLAEGGFVATEASRPGEPAPRSATETPAAPDDGPRRSSILIVDDDLNVQLRLKSLLLHDGMHVRTARSCAEAVAAIDEGLPDGAIVDLRLPDGPGYTIVRALRAREQADRGQYGRDDDQGEAQGRAAVIIVSLTDFLDNAEAIRAGADACFEKPSESDWEGIVRKLHHLLERQGEESQRVLVVEDDAAQSKKVRVVLESAGYTVRVCDAPRHFNSVLSEYKPDLILMDINLPEISGYDLAKYVRQDDQYVTLPIVFLTSENDERARIDTVRAGGDAHLTKPVKNEVLIANVAARLERARFLKTLLNRDGLTRLLTHTSFMEQAATIVAQKRRDRTTGSLAMIDIDHFKTVNDTYGHQAGDRVLVSLASLLRRHLRRSDIVGRYGGEEFAVLLSHVNEHEATRLLLRLLHEFTSREHRAPNGEVFRVTFSAGVATLDADAMDLQRWLEAADATLYAAKRAGRNRVITNTERLESFRVGH
jgi:diguanylate cyclase (GGDEF)-like protein